MANRPRLPSDLSGEDVRKILERLGMSFKRGADSRGISGCTGWGVTGLLRRMATGLPPSACCDPPSASGIASAASFVYTGVHYSEGGEAW